MTFWTTGNTAKVYCLQWIHNAIDTHGTDLRILDVGSGTSNNFISLLQAYPDVEYVGIEPSAAACEIARAALDGTRSRIINDYAYDLMGNLVERPFDIVTSFSVMEHVVQRQRHIDGIAACLKPGGHVLMNYDAGHFVHPESLKERAKTVIGSLLARLGMEQYYQRFVSEAEFTALIDASSLRIVERKFFNTASMKGIHKIVPEADKDAHLERWLQYELWLNDTGLAYKDAYAPYWVTRNVVLQKQM